MITIKKFNAGIPYARGEIIAVNNYLYECRHTHITAGNFDLDNDGVNWRRLPINFQDSTKIAQTVYDWVSGNTYLQGQLVAVNMSSSISKQFLLESQQQQSVTDINSGTWQVLNDASMLDEGIPYFPSARFIQRYWAVNDMVIVNGILYRCIQYHLSNNSFNSSELQYWDAIDTLPLKVYIYTASVWYNVNTIVRYNSRLYVCISAHNSKTAFDEDKWAVITYYGNMYKATYEYVVGVTFYNVSTVYVCKQQHISATIINTNNELSNFDELAYFYSGSGGGTPSGGGGTPSNTETHYPGEIRTYNGKVYYCTTQYTSAAGTIDLTKYDEMKSLPITAFDWRSGVYYSKYYFVLTDSRSKLYFANDNHYSQDVFDLIKWNLIFANIKDWQTNTYYNKNQVVIYDEKIWIANSAHTSYTPFDITLWTLFGIVGKTNKDTIENKDSSLSGKKKPIKLKKWAAGEKYEVGDYVLYNGAIYLVVVSHIAVRFEKQLLYFKLLASDVGEWKPSTEYDTGDIFKKDNTLYEVKNSYTSGSTFDTLDTTNTELYFTSNTSVYDWTQNTEYEVGDLVFVIENCITVLYKCIVDHVSGSVFDSTKWYKVTNLPLTAQEVVGGNQYLVATWKSGDIYKLEDVILYNGKLYKCISSHTALSDFNNDLGNWQVIGDNLDPDDWQYSKSYNIGDLVEFEGRLFECNTAHISGLVFNPNLWNVVSNIVGIVAWQPNTDYVVGNIVVYEGKLYKCNAAHTSGDEIALTKFDLIFELDLILEQWKPSTQYLIGDIVKVWDVELNIWVYYACKTAHISGLDFDDIEKQYWDELNKEDSPQILDSAGRLYHVGDLILYNGKLYKVIVEHCSTDFAKDSIDKVELVGDGIDEWKPLTAYKKNQLVVYNKVIYKVQQDIITSASAVTDFGNLGGLIFIGALAVIFLEWQPEVYYPVGSLVVYNEVLYVCITAHISGLIFDNDELEYWKFISEFPLNIEPWKRGTSYVVGDLIYASDYYHPLDLLVVYVCINPHISVDIATEGANWESIIPNEVEYKVGATYPLDAVVKYDGQLVSTNEKQDDAPWVKTFCMAIDLPEYDETKTYNINDMVRVGDAVFRNAVQHSGSSAEKDLLDSIEIALVEEWQPDTDYKVGDIVFHDGKLYRCNTDHHSDTTDFDNDIAYWDDLGWELVRSLPIEDDKWIPVGGKVTIKPWKNFNEYAVGDLVVFDNAAYRCVIGHVVLSTLIGPTNNKDAWEQILAIKDWSPNTEFTSGEIIKYNGNLFTVLNKVYKSGITFEEKGLKGLGVSLGTKSRVIPMNVIKMWIKGTGFIVGDYVWAGNGIYRVIRSHTANYFPLDIDKFDSVYVGIKPWKEGTSYKVGDLVYRGNTLYMCIESHTINTFDSKYWYFAAFNSDGSRITTTDPNSTYVTIIIGDPKTGVSYTKYGTASALVNYVTATDGVDIDISSNCLKNILNDVAQYASTQSVII